MTAVAVLVHTPCHICGTANPLRAYLDRCDCTKCGHTSERLDWSWVLESAWSKPTKGMQATGEGESRKNVLGQVTPGAVECSKCKSIFLQSALESAFDGVLGAQEHIPCKQCNTPLLIRPVPNQTRDEYGFISRTFSTRWSAIIGEDPKALVDESLPATLEAPVTIAFQCTSCGAPLTVDGSNRTPLCQFCNTRIFLPDALWEALHPAPPIRPFYLWLDAKGLEQRRYMDATASVKKKWYITIGIWTFLGGPIGGSCVGIKEPSSDFTAVYAAVLLAGIVIPLIGVWIYGAVRNCKLQPLGH